MAKLHYKLHSDSGNHIKFHVKKIIQYKFNQTRIILIRKIWLYKKKIRLLHYQDFSYNYYFKIIIYTILILLMSRYNLKY